MAIDKQLAARVLVHRLSLNQDGKPLKPGEAHITQLGAAKRVGISYASFSAVEQGRVGPKTRLFVEAWMRGEKPPKSTLWNRKTIRYATKKPASSTLTAVNRFNDAFNRHDVNAVMAAMTVDCLFENTNPPPDGARYVGQDSVRAYWVKFFENNPDARFEAEETIAVGDRCTVRWVYKKMKEGKPWHLRGVDVFRVKDGKVAEKLSYVKG